MIKTFAICDVCGKQESPSVKENGEKMHPFYWMSVHNKILPDIKYACSNECFQKVDEIEIKWHKDRIKEHKDAIDMLKGRL